MSFDDECEAYYEPGFSGNPGHSESQLAAIRTKVRSLARAVIKRRGYAPEQLERVAVEERAGSPRSKLGHYAPRTRTVVIYPDDLTLEGYRMTLVHELAHALVHIIYGTTRPGKGQRRGWGQGTAHGVEWKDIMREMGAGELELVPYSRRHTLASKGMTRSRRDVPRPTVTLTGAPFVETPPAPLEDYYPDDEPRRRRVWGGGERVGDICRRCGSEELVDEVCQKCGSSSSSEEDIIKAEIERLRAENERLRRGGR